MCQLFRQQFEKLFADFVALWFVAEEKWYLRKAFSMLMLRVTLALSCSMNQKNFRNFFAIVDAMGNCGCFLGNCGCSLRLFFSLVLFDLQLL